MNNPFFFSTLDISEKIFDLIADGTSWNKYTEFIISKDSFSKGKSSPLQFL